ncbi:MAG: GTPase [Elusimicrobia bacterium]|nr:GTPase [Elusimicrobiota bacterium]
MKTKKVIIMGAAGRDFHNFNVYYRNNPEYEVVAFTAEQIPNIAGRFYPASLAGKLYPKGIPIYPETNLPELIKELKADEAVFSYSDVPYETLMQKAALVLACGANFKLLGPASTMIASKKKVVSVCAVRTGCGKSQTSRKVASVLKELGKKTVIIRHPMPYGDLEKQVCQRYQTLDDMENHQCTIEEMEEYEDHIKEGNIVYAGVDYGKILEEAEKEADVVLWDGGNNDLPFYKPDLHIVVTDPHRPGHERRYYPGETNLIMADIVIINKVDTANPRDVQTVRENAFKLNPDAVVIETDSPVTVDHPEKVRGKRVLVIEDGPTLTHGEMGYGAATVAASQFGALEIVDPRPYATGSLREIYLKYPHLQKILPAMGYGKEQVKELKKAILDTPCDLILIGTPVDLGRLMKLDRPYLHVYYSLAEKQPPTLKDLIKNWLAKEESCNPLVPAKA